MDALLLTARCILGVVFLVAAAGKLFDLTGSRQALEGFGVPTRWARLAGPALPVAELAVAAALLVRPTAVIGAAAALALLVVFIAGVARAISQGRAPECHCFGQIHSEPAGPSTLVRNALLAALAVLVLVRGPGPSLDGGLGRLNGTQAALVAVAVLATLLAVALIQLWREKRGLERELEALRAGERPPGLPRGTPAPEFALPAVRGSAGSLAELLASGKRPVLVFVSTGCGPCLEMLPTLGRWQDSLGDALALAAVFSGEREAIERLCDEHDLSLALAQELDEILTLYALRVTPSAVLLDPDGTVAAAPAEGVPAIEGLIRSALSAREARGIAVHAG